MRHARLRSEDNIDPVPPIYSCVLAWIAGLHFGDNSSHAFESITDIHHIIQVEILNGKTWIPVDSQHHGCCIIWI